VTPILSGEGEFAGRLPHRIVLHGRDSEDEVCAAFTVLLLRELVPHATVEYLLTHVDSERSTEE